MKLRSHIRGDAEVSCRAFGYFTYCEELGLVDLEPILDELGLERAELEEPTNRVSWEAWATLFEHALAVMGEETLEASSRVVLGDNAFARPLRATVGALAQPEQLYRVGLTWLAPFRYRDVEFRYQHIGGRRVEVYMRLPDAARGSRGWSLFFRGVMRTLPQLIGLDESQVETLALTARECHLLLTLPTSNSLFTQVRRVLAALRSGELIQAEFDAQRAQLDASWRALEQSERSFRNALDALPAAVGLYVDQRWVYINPLLARLLGDPAPEPHELHDIEGRPLLGHVEAGSGSREVRVDLRDGRYIDAMIALHEGVSFGGNEASMFVAMDISRRVEAEQTLARTRQTLQSLRAVTPDLILRFDHDEVLLDVIRGSGELSGEQLEPFIGQPFERIVAAFGTDGRTLEVFREAAASRERRRIEVVGAPPTRRNLEIRMLPGDMDVVLLVRDVTRLRELEERLRQSERMASLGTLAAGVAHEINNPLTYVMANLDEALEEHREPRRRGLLTEAIEGVERIRDIVARLGQFSRSRSPRHVPVSLEQVAQGALKMTHHALRHQAEVRTHFAQAPAVRGDARELGQVVMNLLLNAGQALEATGRFGVVELSTGVDAQGQPFLRVRDDGPGMSEATLSRVFEPFFTTREGVGTGLGLAISRRIVRAHGGEVQVESQPGAGTAITVTLPPLAQAEVCDDNAPADAPSVAEDEEASPPRRALVLDDDRSLGKMLARMLSRDFDVALAHEGERALARVAEAPPDVIFCDMMMPGMDGVTFFERLSEEHPEMTARVIFLTGGVFTEGASQLLARVDNLVIQKPFHPAELRQQVREWFAARGE